jgi:hypothetical protein
MKSLLLTAVLLLSTAGCAAKKPVGVNLIIAIRCLNKDVELLGCTNLQNSPPTCHTAKVAYKKGCEVVKTTP